MQIVACWNRKGGAGKTTLAVHLVAGLALLGRRALLVDVDGQGNGFRWISGHTAELEEGAQWQGNGVIAVYFPSLTNLVRVRATRGVDVAVIDCPPSESPAMWVGEVDLILVPMIGRLSVDGGSEIVFRLKKKCLVVPNQVRPGAWNQFDLDAMASLGVEVADPIPLSDTVRRAEQLGVPAWAAPYGEGSAAAVALMGLTEAVDAKI